MTEAVDEWAECNKFVLDFLENLPDLSSDTALYFSMEKMKDTEQTIGSRYNDILVSAVNNAKINELIAGTDFPKKKSALNFFFNAVRIKAVHDFISESLVDCVDYPTLVAYSAKRLEKSVAYFRNSDHTPPVAKKKKNGSKTKSGAGNSFLLQNQPDINALLHPLEVISVNREFRSIVNDVDIEVRPFDEQSILQKNTVDGKVNYTQVFAQLRHSYTNYDLLRSSRKMRRNTYWKMTVRPAVRLAICEKLLLLTKDEQLHMYLLMQIQSIHSEFISALMRVAKEENFIEAMDEYFKKAMTKKVFTAEKKRFMLRLQTL